MKRYALIENNIVVNVIVWDGVQNYDRPDGMMLVEGEQANIGDIYDVKNGLFTKPA